MNWEKVLELVKLFGPYILEIIKLLVGAPKQAASNVRAVRLVKMTTKAKTAKV